MSFPMGVSVLCSLKTLAVSFLFSIVRQTGNSLKLIFLKKKKKAKYLHSVSKTSVKQMP